MSGIVIDSVTKRFGDVVAVAGVSLEIEQGEFMVLVGPSGCGKSTILRMVAGLEEVSAGRIAIAGRDVTWLEPKDRDVAMVFQNYALYPHMTVEQNLAFSLSFRRTPKDELRRRVGDVARILGLEGLLERRPSQLSGGQRQRVAIGRAMVREPQAFLMDEPLSNLDAKLRVQMRTELARLHGRLRTTTMYVTHDQVEAMTLGDRVAVLRDGELQQVGSPGELYHRPANLFVAAFIGSPSMNVVEATVEQGELLFGGLRLPLGRSTLPVDYRERTVVFGIRPSGFVAAELARDASQPELEVVPQLVENLGDQIHVVFPIDAPPVAADALRAAADDPSAESDLKLDDAGGGSLFVAVLDAASQAVAGRPLRLRLNTDALLFFDPRTGDALTGPSGSASPAP